MSGQYDYVQDQETKRRRYGRYRQHVDKAYEKKEFDELAESPVDALEGLSKADAEALHKALNIRTIRDLAEKQVRASRAGDSEPSSHNQESSLERWPKGARDRAETTPSIGFCPVH